MIQSKSLDFLFSDETNSTYAEQKRKWPNSFEGNEWFDDSVTKRKHCSVIRLLDYMTLFKKLFALV